MGFPRRLLWVGLSIVLATQGAFASNAPSLQVAQLGDCPLESGDTIENCRLGYRIFGERKADDSKAILIPTWFRGTSQDLAVLVGPGKLLDSSKYLVIAVDAFGNGVSSSPSNSRTQPGRAFPRFTVRDMVAAQHRFLTEHLQLDHLLAVVGLSMGGMQALEWMVAYPDFMDKVVSIVGSPRLTSYDLLLWEAELRVIKASEEGGGAKAAARDALAAIHTLALTTPDYRVVETPPERFPDFLKDMDARFARYFPLVDYASQLRAMMAHDIFAPFGGSLERALAAMRAELFVVVARQDHMVNPRAALELAQRLSAQIYELPGLCGHLAPVCQRETLTTVVNRFLEREA